MVTQASLCLAASLAGHSDKRWPGSAKPSLAARFTHRVLSMHGRTRQRGDTEGPATTGLCAHRCAHLARVSLSQDGKTETRCVREMPSLSEAVSTPSPGESQLSSAPREGMV